MKISTIKKSEKIYDKLLSHFNKQYKNVASIQRVYINDGKVFAGDFTQTDGTISLASGSLGSDKVVEFE